MILYPLTFFLPRIREFVRVFNSKKVEICFRFFFDEQKQPIQQQAQDAMWQNDVFATDASVAAAFGHQSAAIGGGSSIETGTKLYISNLDYGVSNEDIKVFASIFISLCRSQ